MDILENALMVPKRDLIGAYDERLVAPIQDRLKLAQACYHFDVGAERGAQTFRAASACESFRCSCSACEHHNAGDSCGLNSLVVSFEGPLMES